MTIRAMIAITVLSKFKNLSKVIFECLGAMEEGRCKCPRILREGDTKFYRFEVIKNIFDDERCGKNEID